MVFQGHVTHENHYISNTTVPMATKLAWMVTYLKQFSPIKLLGSC